MRVSTRSALGAVALLVAAGCGQDDTEPVDPGDPVSRSATSSAPAESPSPTRSLDAHQPLCDRAAGGPAAQALAPPGDVTTSVTEVQADAEQRRTMGLLPLRATLACLGGGVDLTVSDAMSTAEAEELVSLYMDGLPELSDVWAAQDLGGVSGRFGYLPGERPTAVFTGRDGVRVIHVALMPDVGDVEESAAERAFDEIAGRVRTVELPALE